MKERVLEQLMLISEGRDTEMKQLIAQDFADENINLVFEKRANWALENILYDYSRFEVSTIDYFFTRLIRSLTHELKLPSRYEIDIDNEKAIEAAIDRLFDELPVKEEVRSWLEDFSYNRIDSDQGWRIEPNIKELGMELFKEKFHELYSSEGFRLDELKHFIANLQNTRKEFENGMKERAREAIGMIDGSGLEVKDFKRWTADKFYQILDGNFELKKTFTSVAKGEGDWFTGKSLKKARIRELVDSGLGDIAKEILDYYSRLYPKYISSKELLRNIYAYGLLDLIRLNLREYRSENRVLLLSDTHFLLKDIICQDEDACLHEAPFLYEKFGSRFKHILIDEFQDTSNYQWFNLLPLVMNSVSNQHLAMIVGDVKQSIYRWRGGNMHLLLEQAQKDLSRFRDLTDENTLNTNYRSARPIVEFNNAFFRQAIRQVRMIQDFPQDDPLIDKAYSEVEQEIRSDKEGYVEFRFFPRLEEEIDWKTKAKQSALAAIDQAISDGYDYNDILILVDTGELGNEMAEFLSLQGKPFISDSSLMLENSMVIRFLLSTMTWMVNPEDQVARVNVVLLYNEINKDSISHIHDLVGVALDETGEFFNEHFPDSFLQEALKKTLYELVEELIIRFDLNRFADSYLKRFQDICLDNTSKGNLDISDFLRWWEETKTRKDQREQLSIITPSRENAIMVMTIHKAKGLEYPVVIVPFASYRLKPLHETMFWTGVLEEPYRDFKILPLNFNSDLEQSEFAGAYRKELMEGVIEKLNQTYVAFTRPRERLYVFSEQFKVPVSDEDPGNLHKLIYSVFNNPGFKYHGKWDENEWTLQLGACTPRTREKEEEPAAFKMRAYQSSKYLDRISIRPESNRFFLLFDNAKSEKIKDGVRTHTVLERITKKEDLDQILVEMTNQGLVEDNHYPAIREKVDTLFDNDLFRDWLEGGWEVYSEKEIFSDGKAYRPDKVLVRNDEAVVIDFKREKEREQHIKQIKNYADLLENLGHTNIRKYLVYVEDLRIVEVE